MEQQIAVTPYPIADQAIAPGIYSEVGYSIAGELPAQASEYLGSVAIDGATVDQRPSAEPLDADFQAWDNEVENSPDVLAARREERRQAIVDLEHGDTFPDDGIRYQAADMMAATGMPIGNVRTMRYEANRRGREDVLASFGVGRINRGEYTVYSLLGRVIPEKQFGTHWHELSHASSPLRRENTHLFGDEAGRRQAELQVIAIAEQSRVTGVHLNGYHKLLLERLSTDEIDLQTYNEETWAIASEMAMTNRGGLERVEADQHARVRDMQRSGELPADYQPVNLVSHEDRNGQVNVDGVDGLLINLVDGVDDYESLIAHGARLKAEFYPQGRSLAVANQRHLGRFGRPLVEYHEDEEISEAERRRRGLRAGRTAVALAA